MALIVALPGVSLSSIVERLGEHQPEIQSPLVDLLEDLLQAAKRGEITGIGFAAVTANHEGTCGYLTSTTDNIGKHIVAAKVSDLSMMLFHDRLVVYEESEEGIDGDSAS